MVARLLTLPSLSAGGLGRFRIYVGLALLLLLARETPPAPPLELHRVYSPLADNALVHFLAASPSAWRAVQVFGILAAISFTVGWWTRTAYAALVATLLVTRLTLLHSRGVHDWDCPMAILIALLIVPWGDGLSLDQRLRRTVTADARDARYGFAIFAPVFVMGLALAAAAFAKLTVSGVAWVTTGAVRYHFVEDADNAATAWGLWVAAHPAVAILLSGAAVALEATWIATIALRGPLLRLLGASAALGLFLGFYAFQGPLWLPWLMWIGALLPWDGWRPLPAAPLRGSHAAVATAALAVQAVASLAPVEIEPLMSPYPMYSRTYESPQEFERQFRWRFQRVRFTSGPEVIEVEGDAADSLSVAVDTGVIDAHAAKALERACQSVATPAIELHVSRARLDWSAPRVTTTWGTVNRTLRCGPS